MIEVVCADGAVRHEPFESIGEAQRWAEWGHCCLATHSYRRKGQWSA
jgi:hypothetical protein